jgi:hypothetical protein
MKINYQPLRKHAIITFLTLLPLSPPSNTVIAGSNRCAMVPNYKRDTALASGNDGFLCKWSGTKE